MESDREGVDSHPRNLRLCNRLRGGWGFSIQVDARGLGWMGRVSFGFARALKSLADDQLLPAKRVSEAIAKYGIDPEKPNPARV